MPNDKLLDFEGLTYYDQKIKTYIQEQDNSVSTDLENQLQQEATTRSQADQTLQQNINSEQSERIAADQNLQQNIDSEETSRQSADTALGSRIDNVINGTTPVNKVQNALSFGVTGDLDTYNGSVAKTITKSTLGLGNVDNTSDANKPVSTAQQQAIDSAISDLIGDAGTNYNTLGKLEDAIQAETTRAQQEENSIDDDLQGFKTSTNQNITQLEQDLATEGNRITTLENNTVKKTGQTSQTIQGNFAIQGDLTVSGTTVTQDQETLMVKDNMIVANSDAINITNLSGLAIRMDSTQVFGVVYDPSTDELKAGIGTLSVQNEFTFSSGEGYPLTLRDSDTEFTDGHVVMWDNIGKKIVDANIAATNIAVQTGTYANMHVGYATNDGSGNNIEQTYVKKTYIPQPTTSDNGKILGVENGVYSLITQYTYTLPTATNTVLGGVMPVTKTDQMTQEVGVDSTGKLFTLPAEDSITWATNDEIDDLFVSPTFSSSTWEEINQYSEMGLASTYFNVGDEKTIQLSTGEQVTLVILGFNHDDLSDGSGKAGITFGMKNLLAAEYRMNATNTNTGGWNDSEMRTSTMQTLFSQLPSDLQSVIKQVNKKATAGSISTAITTSADKLWLLSEVEVDGTTTAGYADEGEQYEYWKTVKDGTVRADRIKYLSNGSGSANYWWLRSPVVPNNTGFRRISNSGSITNVIAGNDYGVSFGFCV